jgi:NitT/TauT family transport system substrate-binding protein
VRRSIFLGSAAAAAVAARSASASAASETLRVGVLQGDSSAEPLYAQALGIFDRHGLGARIESFPGGAAVIAAVLGGALDVGFSNVVSLANAVARGLPIVALAPASLFTSSVPDVRLCKARGSALRTGSDLNGKTIAVTSLGGLLSVGASAWIDKNGGDAKTVKFVELVFSEMGAALKQKRIDAAMISEPLLTEAAADIEPLGDAFGAIAPEFIIGAFVASRTWAAANVATARAFNAAMHDTAAFANANRPATAKILTTADKLDPATVAAMARATYGTTFSAALLEPPLHASFTYGVLATKPDVAALLADAQPYVSSPRR